MRPEDVQAIFPEEQLLEGVRVKAPPQFKIDKRKLFKDALPVVQCILEIGVSGHLTVTSGFVELVLGDSLLMVFYRENFFCIIQKGVCMLFSTKKLPEAILEMAVSEEGLIESFNRIKEIIEETKGKENEK